MVKKRLVPKLLIKNQVIGPNRRPVLVTTRAFNEIINIGDPVSQAKIYEAQLADELIVLNIDRSPVSRDSTILALIERLASETFMPLTVGGGVRSVEDFERLLERGADKVSINSAALASPDLITQASNRYGAQCVVVSIDLSTDPSSKCYVVTNGGKTPVKLNVVDWAVAAVAKGAGELLLTDVDRDGEGRGLNWGIGREVASNVSVPVILSGGCGLAEHFVEGFEKGLAEAVAAGTFFCFRDQNPMQTRAHIRNAGVLIRMQT